MKIVVDWDVKEQTKQKKKELSHCKFLVPSDQKASHIYECIRTSFGCACRVDIDCQ